MKGDLLERFWSKVQTTDGCWLWIGGLDRHGYGRLKVDGRMVLGHRLSYQLLVGPIPDGLVLDHLCRVRNCVKPDHLEPVTGAENTCRGVHGKPTARLTESDVVFIRTSFLRTAVLAHKFGVSEVAVRQARNGTTWADVPVPPVSRRIGGYCKHGHRLVEGNLESNGPGKFRCLTCARDRDRKRRELRNAS